MLQIKKDIQGMGEVWLSPNRDVAYVYPEYVSKAVKTIGSYFMPMYEEEYGKDRAGILWDKVKEVHKAIDDFYTAVKDESAENSIGMSLESMSSICKDNPLWSTLMQDPSYEKARNLVFEYFFYQVTTNFYVGMKEASHGGTCK